jgi:hypothetical protein
LCEAGASHCRGIALGDFMGVPAESVNNDRLYRAPDRLLRTKGRIRGETYRMAGSQGLGPLRKCVLRCKLAQATTEFIQLIEVSESDSDIAPVPVMANRNLCSEGQ